MFVQRTVNEPIGILSFVEIGCRNLESALMKDERETSYYVDIIYFTALPSMLLDTLSKTVFDSVSDNIDGSAVK